MAERSLRRLLNLGTNSVIIKRHVRREPQPGTWLGSLLMRKPLPVVRVELFNQMARAVWALMVRGGVYRDPAAAAKSLVGHERVGAEEVKEQFGVTVVRPSHVTQVPEGFNAGASKPAMS